MKITKDYRLDDIIDFLVALKRAEQFPPDGDDKSLGYSYYNFLNALKKLGVSEEKRDEIHELTKYRVGLAREMLYSWNL